MNGNIHIVEILAIILLFNSKTQLLDEMLIAIDNFKNVLDYCDFESICVDISKFPWLSHKMFNGGLIFHL